MPGIKGERGDTGDVGEPGVNVSSFYIFLSYVLI